ncbi:MAG TPA: PHP domain-containing protein [bacterium]|nr:PHP domain-containing protein [bacterium]
MIDLHIHTIASDGQYTGAETVARCRDLDLEAIAIADHNSVDSVAEAEAAAQDAGIEFAPAVELDTIFRGRDLHILGYFIAYRSPECNAYMEEIHREKIKQAGKRVSKLRENGFVIEFNELIGLSGGRTPTGVEYIAALKLHPENLQNPAVRAFIDGPRSDSPFKNFYLDWLRAGRPAFVPLEIQPAERAIAMIKKLSGVPVLAHPSDTPEHDVNALIDFGLMGLEVYSSYHDPAATARFLDLARRTNVLITAGSDYHGPNRKPEVKLASIPGNSYDLFRKLKNAAGIG